LQGWPAPKFSNWIFNLNRLHWTLHPFGPLRLEGEPNALTASL
jgi:hypothetical protein